MFQSGAFGYLSDYLLWWVCFLSLITHTWCFFRFYPRSKYKRSGLVLGNALVLGCLLGVLAMAGESYYRFVAVETDSFGVSLPARRWFAIYPKYNKEGFRDREWVIPKPRGVRRIAVVGDSFVYGWGIPDTEDRFPELIETRFRQAGLPAVELMNVARPGWNTGSQIKELDRVLSKYAIDEVLLGYVLNDLEDLIPKTGEMDPTRPPVPTLFNIDSSPLLDHLYRTIWLPRVPTVRNYQRWLASGYEAPNIWAAQVERLRRFVAICRKRNVKVRVALLPYLRVDPKMLDRAAIHQEIRQAIESLGVKVVDLLPAVEGKDWRELIVNRNDAHPNEAAHALFADMIWNAFYRRSS